MNILECYDVIFHFTDSEPIEVKIPPEGSGGFDYIAKISGACSQASSSTSYQISVSTAENESKKIQRDAKPLPGDPSEGRSKRIEKQIGKATEQHDQDRQQDDHPFADEAYLYADDRSLRLDDKSLFKDLQVVIKRHRTHRDADDDEGQQLHASGVTF